MGPSMIKFIHSRSSVTKKYSNFIQNEKKHLSDVISEKNPVLMLSGKEYYVLPFKLRSCTFLVSLDLSHNNLHTLPPFFSNFTLLEDLNLSHNMFIDINIDYEKLTHLQTLNLSFNHIEYVSQSILRISSLKTLNLRGNVMESLPSFVGLLNLEELDLRDNLILTLGDSLSKLKKLTTLKVDYTKLLVSPTFAIQKFASSTKHDSIPNKESELKKGFSIEKRARAVIEILESERKYNKYMGYLFENFYLSARSGKLTEECSIPKEELMTILPSVFDPILNLSNQILKSLELAIDQSTNSSINESKIGALFCTYAPFFKMYADYVSEYHKSNENIYLMMKKYPAFEEFLLEKSSHPDADRLVLTSLLVMPVQRIMRYNMLVRGILSVCKENDHDFLQVTDAAEKMDEIAKFIDEKVEDFRCASKTAQLTLELNLEFNRQRRYVAEGEYIIGSDLYHIYLFNDIFLFRRIDLLQRIFGISDSIVVMLKNTCIEEKDGCVTLKFDKYEFVFTDPFWTNLLKVRR